MTLNVSSAVGFIALFGVSIQNGVIMISHINSLRQHGMALKEAVINGAYHRFRPVLMIGIVAVLGLLPASVSTGIGSDVQRPLATVIVYGLLFATSITLYVLPALYKSHSSLVAGHCRLQAVHPKLYPPIFFLLAYHIISSFFL